MLMARILSYLITALIAGVVGAQLAAPDAPSRAERADRVIDIPRAESAPRADSAPAERLVDPKPELATNVEPLPAEQLAARAEAEKRGVVSMEEAARAGYLELVRRNSTRTHDEDGRRVAIKIDPFDRANQQLAQSLGNSWLGTRRVTIRLERADSGKVRVLDPDRGRREGLRLWADLEFEEDQLPAYLAPYRVYVPR